MQGTGSFVVYMAGKAKLFRVQKSTGGRETGILLRRFVVGALLLLFLSSSCNLPGRVTPTSIGTILPQNLPTITPGIETPTASIPITGLDVTLQCQFCVNDEPHAVLILPETADFNVSGPLTRINCITAQVVSDSRVLICRGAQQASFSLNVCIDNSNCTQFPVTLETCPLGQQAVIATPLVTVTQPAPAPVSPTPTSVLILPASPTPTTTPPPAQTVTSQTPAVATTPAPLQPTASSTPGIRLPRTSLRNPDGFMRWYFGEVWRGRDYQDLWDNYLTPSFKTRTGSGSYEDYVAWWSSVERVDINSVEVIQNDGTRAWVRVNVTFTMMDGRVVANQEYDYDLLYDPNQGTWMFDYRT